MKVPLPKLAKLIGETVEALENLQGSVLPDGVEVELETSVLAYCNWLRSGGKAKQSVEMEIRQEQLRKLTADRKFAESRVSGTGATLTECATVLGVKTDTLKKWHGHGCPGEKDGSVWKFDTAKVFAWKLEKTREECTPKPAQNESPVEGFEAIDPDYERARKDKEMADKLALGNARLRGEMIEVEEVCKMTEGFFGILRSKVMNMPLTPDEIDACLLSLMSFRDVDWSAEARQCGFSGKK
jgi:phage terminase Nu1 subunit (DNA packaging protein)